MASGRSPHYSDELAFGDLTPEQFLGAAMLAIAKLEWLVERYDTAGFIAHSPPSIRSGGEEISLTMKDDNVAVIESRCGEYQVTDWGANEKNVQKFTEALNEILASVEPENLATLFREGSSTLVSVMAEQEGERDAEEKEEKTRARDFLSLVVPREGYFITPILIILNVVVFILMVVMGANLFQPDTLTLVNWGANYRPITLDGGLWRLLTSCFLHIGILHLLLNMYALSYIGVLLEPILGRVKYATAYLTAGIMGSTASVFWNEATVSAGASGAIFGLYGVFLALLTTNLIERSVRKSLLSSIGVFIGFNLVIGLGMGFVDNAAHIGGLIGGLVTGYAFYPALAKPRERKLQVVVPVISVVALLAISYAVVAGIPNDVAIYDRTMKQFSELETSALRVYQLADGGTPAEILTEIRERGIPQWKGGLALVRSMDTLDIPELLRERSRYVEQYCLLRIQSYELMYKQVEEDTDRYTPQLDSLNNAIEALVEQLQGTKK